MTWFPSLHEVLDAITSSPVPRPVLGWHGTLCAFSLAVTMAVNVAPGIGMYEAEFVGGNAHDLTVLEVQRLVVMVQAPGPDCDMLRQARECREFGAWKVAEWMEVDSIYAAEDPACGQLSFVSNRSVADTVS